MRKALRSGRALWMSLLAVAMLLPQKVLEANAAQPSGKREIAASSADATPIDLPDTARFVVLDHVTGIAAVVLEGQSNEHRRALPGTAAFYQSLMRSPLPEPIKVELPGAKAIDIALVVHKGERLFLVSDDLGAVHLVDPTTGKVRSTVKIDAPTASIIASPDGTKAFYSVKRDSRERAGPQPRLRSSSIGMIDLLKNVDLGLLSMDRDVMDHDISLSSGSGVRIAAISHDGEHLYLARPNSSPSGIFSCTPDVQNRTIRLVHRDHDSTEAYVATPLGTTCQQALMSPSLTREVRKLPHTALVSIPGTPFVVGYDRTKGSDDHTLVVMSLNTGQVVREATLPEVKRQPGAGERRRRNMSREDATMHVDAASSALLLERAEGLSYVKLDSLRLPAEPLLGFRVKGDRVATVDRPWSVELEPLSPGLKLAMGEAPEGLKLAGNALAWTPKLDQIGDKLLPISVSSGGTSAVQLVELTVQASSIDLPFVPTLVSVGPDAKHLAIASAASWHKRASGNDRAPSRAAIVDLATREIVLDKLVDYNIAKLALTKAGTLLLTDSDADAIHTISLTGQERTIYTKGRPQSLTVAADQVFVATAGESGTIVSAYSAESFAPIEHEGQIPRPSRGFQRSATQEVPVAIEKGWLVDGVLRSGDLSAVDLVQTFGLFSTNSELNAADGERGMRVQGIGERVRWGARALGNKLERTSGQTIAQSKGGGLYILSKHPLAISLNAEQRFENNQNLREHSLVITELATGKSRSMPVLSGSARGSDQDVHSFHNEIDRIFEFEDGVGVIISDRILFFSYEQLEAAGATMPLHFVPKQSTLVASATKPTTLTYEVKGGTKPITFSLGRALEGVTIDKSTGSVTIDPATLSLEQIIDQSVAMVIMRVAASDDGSGRPPQDSNGLPEKRDWADLLSDEHATIRSRAGIEVTGLPLVLRVGVKARDANQQEAVLTHEVLLDISPDTLDMRYSEYRRKRLEQEQAFKRQQKPPEVTESRDRLAAENQRLREEIERLKGQIELLKQMLDEQKNKK